MKRFDSHMLIIIACIDIQSEGGRQRILFINEAPESVLVSISHYDRPPVQRSIIERGERKYFFPPELSRATPYFINLDSMFSQTKYVLRLTIDLQRALVRSCHAYGDLQLMRSVEIIQSIGASGSYRGIVLTYTPDYELKIGQLQVIKRPHSATPKRFKKCSAQCT